MPVSRRKKKRHTYKTGKSAVVAPLVFHNRVIHFCDCGSKFDDDAALESHARQCAFADDGMPVRELLILTVEGILREVQKRTGGFDFAQVIFQLALIEVAREKGATPKTREELRRMRDLTPTFEATDEEVEQQMIEVASWYGFTQEELLNGACDLPPKRLEAERESRRRLNALLTEQRRIGVPILLVLDEWRDKQTREAKLKLALFTEHYIEEAMRKAKADAAYETDNDGAFQRAVESVTEEVKAGHYEQLKCKVFTVGLEEVLRTLEGLDAQEGIK